MTGSGMGMSELAQRDASKASGDPTRHAERSGSTMTQPTGTASHENAHRNGSLDFRHGANPERFSASPFAHVESNGTTRDQWSSANEQKHFPLPVETAVRYDGIDDTRKPSEYLEVISWWIPELIASALSIASFASIVATLLIYDRRAVAGLDMPSGLTLNGIIALLATVGRVCLCAPVCSALLQEMWLYFARESKKPMPTSRLEDLELFLKASYGTFGSLEFLARSSSSKIVAGIGCLIMVLSLAFGTFVQQLVAYEVLPMGGTAALDNVPRSEAWKSVESTSLLPTLEMLASLYNGILGGGVQLIEPMCPSGNCTWPTTPSIAVCGECEEFEPSLVNYYNKDKLSNCTADSTDEQCKGDMFCNYSLVSGRNVDIWNATKYSAASAGIYDDLAGFYAFQYIHFPEPDKHKDYLVRLDLFGLPYGIGEKGSEIQAMAPRNHQCSLWTCVQYYNISVESGELRQETVATNDNSDQFGSDDESDGYYFGPMDHGLGANQEVNYTASFDAVNVIKMFFYKNLRGNATVSTTDTAKYENDFIRGMWNGSIDANAWIANVATSMTNVLRSNDRLERAEFNGTQYELAVRVRWLWGILPASLVLSSALFMVAVMVRTAHSPVRSWKGSPLTMLLFDLDADIRDAASGRVEVRDGVEKASGKQKVRLVKETDGRRKFVVA